MSRLADIQRLQDERNVIAKQMKDHRDALETNSEGFGVEETAEWQAKFDAMSTDYDSKKASQDALQNMVIALNSADEKLGNHAEVLNTRFQPKAGKEFTPEGLEFAATDWMECQAQALAAWVWGNDPKAQNMVTNEMKQAANAVGIDITNLANMEIKLSPTYDFMNTRNAWYNTQLHRGRPTNIGQVGKGSSGGFLVGQTLLNRLEQAMLDFSGVLQVADIIRTSTGEKLDWPMVDDTGNTGVRIGEGATEATASDPSWQRLSLYAHTYSSSVLKVSRTLLRDSIMNLVVLLGDMLGTRIGRKQNLDFTTGSGAGDAPKGIVTGSTLGVTSSVATAIAFDEIIDLEHAIDPSRRNGASYMFHDGILQVLRKLKDGEGNYLWSNGTQAGAADMINGRPFNINQDMQSTVATATKTVLFGQMNQYKVRQVDGMRMQRLIELYAATNEDGFVVHTDADGGVLNAGDNPIQHLLQS